MKKSNPPEAFGVFKPVGHVVISFRSADDLQATATALVEQGFEPSALVRYTPEQMKALVDASLEDASPLASIGQEVNLVKAQRALAEQQFSFLIVHAPDAEQVKRVAAVARSNHAHTAQSYGRLIIEELIDQTPGDTQVFESPDRGTDIEVPGEPKR
ncbi:MAG: hypothetical protein ABI156_13060 [Caldimonas sp.]